MINNADRLIATKKRKMGKKQKGKKQGKKVKEWRNKRRVANIREIKWLSISDFVKVCSHQAGTPVASCRRRLCQTSAARKGRGKRSAATPLPAELAALWWEFSPECLCWGHQNMS